MTREDHYASLLKRVVEIARTDDYRHAAGGSLSLHPLIKAIHQHFNSLQTLEMFRGMLAELDAGDPMHEIIGKVVSELEDETAVGCI